MPGVVVEKPIVDTANDFSLLLITIAGKFHVKIDNVSARTIGEFKYCNSLGVF